jgi:hypothetical protein
MYVAVKLDGVLFYAVTVSFNGRIVADAKDPRKATKFDEPTVAKIRTYYAQRDMRRWLVFLESLPEADADAGADGFVDPPPVAKREIPEG